MKWYRKLFFHLIDLCLSNAHALYKMRNERATPFSSFRLHVVRSLLKLEPSSSISPYNNPPPQLVGCHFSRQGTSRRCHLCSLRKTVHRTIYICHSCNTSLCAAPCFEEYHTKETLPYRESFRRKRQGDSQNSSTPKRDALHFLKFMNENVINV